MVHKCVVHGKSSLVELSPDNAIECVVHGCDVLNKGGFVRPYVLSEHTLVILTLRGRSSVFICSSHMTPKVTWYQ